MENRFNSHLGTSLRSWFCFICFSLTLSVLAYFPLSFTCKAWIFLLGFGIPLFVIFAFTPTPPPSGQVIPPFLAEDHLGPLHTRPWIGLVLVLIAGLARFWDIGSSNRWPGGDPALTALSVIPWMDHLQWKPFVTLSQIPSTLYYLFYLVTRMTGSFILGIQLPSAVLSFLTLLMGYSAGRIFFPRTLSMILGSLIAFNIWDLMLSRCDEAGVLLPLWEWSVYVVLGLLIKSANPTTCKFRACLLGLVLGLGPYTFMAWPVLAVLVFGIAMGWFWKKRDAAAGGFFLFFLFLALTPFLLSVMREGYGGHLHDVAAWNAPAFSWFAQTWVVFSYFQSIFWGGTPGIDLAPGGGFLNPILGSFLLLGLLEVVKFRRHFLSRFLLVALPLFLLPGLLSRNLEAHRMILVLPILLIIAAVGIQSLVTSVPGRIRLIILVGFLGISAIGDSSRLFLPTTEIKQTLESREDFRTLQALAREQGPGWFFSDMIPNTEDYSLAYCTYPFNAAWNQHLKQDVKWAAVFTQTHYLPFLSKAFPSCQWRVAPADKPGVPSRHALGAMVVTPENRSRLEGWRSFYLIQQELNLESADIPTGKSHQAVLEKFLRAYPQVPADPFLQSCYFEKLVYNFSWENTFNPEDTWTNWKNFSDIFQKSFEKSYRDAELCEKYGHLLAVEGEDDRAKKMLERAVKLAPGVPWLKYEIKQLGLGS